MTRFLAFAGLLLLLDVKPSNSHDHRPPPGFSQLVERLVHTGRYADEGEVVREAIRVLERQEFDESPALEAALLEGVRSPHHAYDSSVLNRIRQNAAAKA